MLTSLTRRSAERATRARAEAEQAAVRLTEERRAAEERAQRLAAERAASEARARQADEAIAQAQRERDAAEARARQATEAAAAAEQERAAAEARAQQAGRTAAEAERERAELRERLQQQLNTVLETRESARGLIVNMSDVLFDTASANLKPGAREKLARVAGVLLTYPELQIAVEGHTDSVGGDDYNRGLSERRAAAVRSYLVSQGIQQQTIEAMGFGESRPVVANTTAAGRQQNRRVELVISGESIAVATDRRERQ